MQFFINNAERGLLKNHMDNEGKNAIFYVVNPIAYGSFENVEILNMIINPGFGFDLAATDKYGKTPLDYAKLQKSGVPEKTRTRLRLKLRTKLFTKFRLATTIV